MKNLNFLVFFFIFRNSPVIVTLVFDFFFVQNEFYENLLIFHDENIQNLCSKSLETET